MTPIKYTPATYFTKATRGPGDVTLVVIHTAECGETTNAAESLASWGGGPNANKASWHYAVDNDSITQSCLEKDIAWHAGPVNNYSIGVEHAGRAAQTAEQWADDYSLATLERSAELVADICTRHGIQPWRLTADDLKRGARSGICGHVDVTNGLTAGKGHQDPGPGFPFAWYIERVQSYTARVSAPRPLSAAMIQTTADVQRALARLGYEPGPVDGVAGPRTKTAIAAYQAAERLLVDGVAGPVTKTALTRSLASVR